MYACMYVCIVLYVQIVQVNFRINPKGFIWDWLAYPTIRILKSPDSFAKGKKKTAFFGDRIGSAGGGEEEKIKRKKKKSRRKRPACIYMNVDNTSIPKELTYVCTSTYT